MIILRSYYLLLLCYLNFNQIVIKSGSPSVEPGVCDWWSSRTKEILGSKDLGNVIFNYFTYIHDTIFSLKRALVLVIIYS